MTKWVWYFENTISVIKRFRAIFQGQYQCTEFYPKYLPLDNWISNSLFLTFISLANKIEYF